MTVKSTACLLGLALALSACKGDPPPAPAPAKTPESEAVKPPPVAPEPPRKQQAVVASDLAQALTKAEPCVTAGRLDRRCVAFRTLRESVRGKRADEGWQSTLRRLLADPGPQGLLALELMADGMVAVGEPGETAATLIKVLDTPKAGEHHREHAVRSLNRVDHPGVFERALKVMTSDESPRVRAAAAYLTAKPAHKAHRPKAVPALVAALKADEASAMRRATIQALGTLKAAEALPHLIKLIDDPMVGPNATMAVAGFDSPKAWTAIYGRLQAMAAGKAETRPALLASLVRLRSHPKYDAAALEQTLDALVKRLAPKAGSDRTINMAHALAKRQLARLRAAKAPAKTPTSKGG